MESVEAVPEELHLEQSASNQGDDEETRLDRGSRSSSMLSAGPDIAPLISGGSDTQGEPRIEAINTPTRASSKSIPGQVLVIPASMLMHTLT